MKDTIYKYALNSMFTRIMLPNNAEILCVKMQDDVPQMWVLLDTKDIKKRMRSFVIVGTGEKRVIDNMKYIDTYEEGFYIWHVFEELNEQVR